MQSHYSNSNGDQDSLDTTDGFTEELEEEEGGEDSTSACSSSDYSQHLWASTTTTITSTSASASGIHSRYQYLRNSATTASTSAGASASTRSSSGTEMGMSSHGHEGSAGTGSRTSVTDRIDNTTGLPAAVQDSYFSNDADFSTQAQNTGSSTGTDLQSHHKHRSPQQEQQRRECGHSSSGREARDGRDTERQRLRSSHKRLKSEGRRKTKHVEEYVFDEKRDRDASRKLESSARHRSRTGERRASRRSRRPRGLMTQLWALKDHPAVAATRGVVADFFVGVNFKIVILSVIMTMLVMKMNQPVLPPVTKVAMSDPEPAGVRGTMLKAKDNSVEASYAAVDQMQLPRPPLPAAALPVYVQPPAYLAQPGLVPQFAVAQPGVVPQATAAYAAVPPPPPLVPVAAAAPVGYAATAPGAGGHIMGAHSAYDQSELPPPLVVQAAYRPPVLGRREDVPLVDHPPHKVGEPKVGDSILDLLDHFHDSWDPYDPKSTPMFWHIPKAGGSSIKDAMGGCHRFVQATEFGVTDGHIDDTEVAVVYPAIPGVADTDRSPFVNIDSTTVVGINRAKGMGFADAGLAQVVVSPFVFELNDLFTTTGKGRLFSIFRHPVERAVSMFYYIQVATWEPSYKPELQQWTLEQYATSEIVENNWMTRQLSNQLGGELTDDNLTQAMEVVRNKFMVGLMSQIEAAMTRFEKYFRWTYRVNPANQEACRARLMAGGSNSNKANKKPLAEGDPAWDLLARQNDLDLQLYAYIEQLFAEQESFVQGLPDDFRRVDATCCKCYPQTFPPEGFTCPQAVKNER